MIILLIGLLKQYIQKLMMRVINEHQKDIINAVTARYLKHQHKFGIKIPSLLEEA